jgi:4-hydroxy-tetrahydrodipicolinate reductase
MSDRPLRLGLFGATGRMGQGVVASLPDHPGLELVAQVGRAGGDPFDDCDVVLDFAVAAATDDLLARLEGTRAALVTGVTGRDAAAEAALDARAAIAPVFAAANFSLGVAVLRALVRQACAAVGPGWDAEVFELHHRHKADAPSGTALALAAEAAAGAGLPWPEARAAVRDGLTGPRGDAEIGLAALRAGGVVGEHTVFLVGPSERLELTHRAADRRVFCHGALRAAAWVAGRPPGRYGMDDLAAATTRTP